MQKFLEKFFKQRNKKKAARLEYNLENDSFVKEASEQIKQLSKKGLSIPVFTL